MDQVCPNCDVGMLHPEQTTYLRVIENTLLSVPNMLAWRCDLCDVVYFDPAQVRLLDLLAGEAGPPPNHHNDPPDGVISGQLPALSPDQEPHHKR